jgi:hypothetical protein
MECRGKREGDKSIQVGGSRRRGVGSVGEGWIVVSVPDLQRRKVRGLLRVGGKLERSKRVVQGVKGLAVKVTCTRPSGA